MSDRIFLDTNVLVYLYSSDEAAKQAIAYRIIDTAPEIIISTQVINELINVLRKKRKLSFEELTTIFNELTSWFPIALIAPSTITQALDILDKFNYTYFDSLMISSALENNCSVLYTEDMHHEHTLKKYGLTIKNPFKS